MSHVTAISVVLQIAQVDRAASQADDLYLDDTGSGGYYPEDDDDFNSGSGSGKPRAPPPTHQPHSAAFLFLSLPNFFPRLSLICLLLAFISFILNFNWDLLVAASGKSANFMLFLYWPLRSLLASSTIANLPLCQKSLFSLYLQFKKFILDRRSRKYDQQPFLYRHY